MSDIDLFISHSSGDAEVARELRAVLEEAGYRCWMAPDDVTGTESWAEQILGGIKDSRAMVVLISSNANQSPHVSREVNLALGRKRAVLPIRIENVAPEASLEYLLSLMQRIDAFPPPIANHRDRILRRIRAVVPVAGVQASPAPVSPERTTEHVPATAEAPAPGLEAAVAAASVADEATEHAPAAAPPTEPQAPVDRLAAIDAPDPIDLPASVRSIGPSSRIGAFTIDSVLGEGGMATVYRATQEEPRRSVALKLIRADHAADATYRQRFMSEKDTLASLEHPSIVPIYAAGEADGVLFIAMRLVDGPDLSAKLAKEGRLSLPETIATLRPIADAIDYAHEMGVIHRDLKPSNVILDRRGRPYLTDFGLGKHIDRPRDISIPGIAIGTLDYMAPEQFSGIVDPSLAGRTDVYALGCVAFTCLTGAPPFRADEPERVMYGHLHGEVPNLRELRPDIPPAVDVAIRRALSKNPADRYPTADAFLQALSIAESISEERTAAIIVPASAGSGGIGGWIRTHALIAGAAASGVALIAVGAMVLGAGGGGSSPSASPGRGATQFAGDNGGGSATPTAGPGPTTAPPPATLPPTLPPSISPTATAHVDPTRAPTQKPPPTVTARPKDTTPPTGGAIRINDGAGYTTSGSVTVNVTTKPSDAQSGVAKYVWSKSNSRPTSGFKAYDAEFGATIDTGTHGTRTIYVWFQNGDGVWSTTPVKDTITFDNKPVSTGYVYNYQFSSDSQWCTAPKINVTVVGYAATDPDGNGTLSLVDVWQGTQHFSLGPNARTQFTFTNPKPLDPSSYTFSYKVRDDDGATLTSTLTFKSGPCPPGS